MPPLVTEINLSLDDRFLYVPCWDTGVLRQYDVSDPFDPRHTTSVHLGGIVRRTPHPRSGPLNGASQKVEVSRDGRRVYFSNAPYSSWDGRFYPDGFKGWVAKANVDKSGGFRATGLWLVQRAKPLFGSVVGSEEIGTASNTSSLCSSADHDHPRGTIRSIPQYRVHVNGSAFGLCGHPPARRFPRKIHRGTGPLQKQNADQLKC